jgi:hypothetical protein
LTEPYFSLFSLAPKSLRLGANPFRERALTGFLLNRFTLLHSFNSEKFELNPCFKTANCSSNSIAILSRVHISKTSLKNTGNCNSGSFGCVITYEIHAKHRHGCEIASVGLHGKRLRSDCLSYAKQCLFAIKISSLNMLHAGLVM